MLARRLVAQLVGRQDGRDGLRPTRLVAGMNLGEHVTDS